MFTKKKKHISTKTYLRNNKSVFSHAWYWSTLQTFQKNAFLSFFFFQLLLFTTADVLYFIHRTNNSHFFIRNISFEEIKPTLVQYFNILNKKTYVSNDFAKNSLILKITHDQNDPLNIFFLHTLWLKIERRGKNCIEIWTYLVKRNLIKFR